MALLGLPEASSIAWTAVIVILTSSLLNAMRRLSGKDHFPVKGRTAIVTGGSQGMGRGVAKILAEQGANVILVARNAEKLKAAVEYITTFATDSSSQRFTYISADLTSPSECVRVIQDTKAWNHGKAPDIVWCLAGSAYPEFFIHMNTDRLREQMDQNYWTAAYMAHAILQEWLQPVAAAADQQSKKNNEALQQPRHLIFTSSVAAFYPPAGYSQYAPAKTAIRSLSDVIVQEVRLYNAARGHSTKPGPEADVKIHTVFPGTIFTPGYEQENLTKPDITKKLEEGDKGQTEDEVASASFRGLQRGEYLVTTTFLGSILRGAAWGGSPRNNWLVDTLFSWIASIAWIFVQPDLDRKVVKWGKDNGHPAMYNK
ncbi:MAG: hypothetical protein M1823_004389 [Watsoniomyces obsoletus]|nr:MAG: hypothetical protein M1823_004389 [Watsoniomyces obsoletus]